MTTNDGMGVAFDGETDWMAEAIRSSCDLNDIHLVCAYPSCKCKGTPRIARAGIRAGLERAAQECERIAAGYNTGNTADAIKLNARDIRALIEEAKR